MSFVVACLFLQEPTAPQPKTQLERLIAAEESLAMLTNWMVENDDRFPQRARTLDCSTGDYREVAPGPAHLPLFVACDKIEPYLEGYRITLKVGNPLAMTMLGLSGEIAHGETFAAAIKTSVRFDTTSELTPGSWTTILVNLNPASVKDVRHIRVKNLKAGAMRGR